MRPGDIYWVEFPAGAGRAQAGRRPAVVLQGANATAALPTVLIVPLTTQLAALRFPGTILIEADKENGLPRTSVALVFQLAAIDQRFIKQNLGQLSSSMLAEVFSSLEALFERKQ